METCGLARTAGDRSAGVAAARRPPARPGIAAAETNPRRPPEKAPDRNREFKYYRLTAAGRRQLAHEQSRWNELVRAISLVMKPV